MVIAYKLAAFSYFIFSRLVKVEFIGLPNLLAKKALAKEFIQHAATAQNIAAELLRLLTADANSEASTVLQENYLQLHLMLKKEANQKAADAVLAIIGQP